MSASDRIAQDLDEVIALQQSTRELSAALMIVRQQIPAIPYQEAHVNADQICDAISRPLYELLQLLLDVKAELRAELIERTLEEADEVVRRVELDEERAAIQAEAAAQGDGDPGRCTATAVMNGQDDALFRCSLPAGHDRQHEARTGDGRVLAVWYPPLQQLVNAG